MAEVVAAEAAQVVAAEATAVVTAEAALTACGKDPDGGEDRCDSGIAGCAGSAGRSRVASRPVRFVNVLSGGESQASDAPRLPLDGAGARRSREELCVRFVSPSSRGSVGSGLQLRGPELAKRFVGGGLA